MMDKKINCKIPWVRDEIILDLALYFSSRKKSFAINSSDVKDFSNLLQSLPIDFKKEKPLDFRNCNGVHYQLTNLHMMIFRHKEKSSLGSLFHKIAEEFSNDIDSLFEISEAIKQNLSWILEKNIIANPRSSNFPEGCLLESLHIYLEHESSQKCIVQSCSTCGMVPETVYTSPLENFMERHLLISPLLMGKNCRPLKTDFTFVCPNCHKALHLRRPWINDLTTSQLFRWGDN